MPSITAEPVSWEAERAELQAVLQSHLFARSPTLTHLLSYLCEKTFAGESDQIKEYSVGLDVFDRRDSFDQDTDSIVRVQANRLRKRLSEYYAAEGAAHPIHITVPVGQYIPVFKKIDAEPMVSPELQMAPQARAPDDARRIMWRPSPQQAWVVGGVMILVLLVGRRFSDSRTAKSTTCNSLFLYSASNRRNRRGPSRGRRGPHPGRAPAASTSITPASCGAPTLIFPAGRRSRAQSSISGAPRIRSSIAAAAREISPTTFP